MILQPGADDLLAVEEIFRTNEKPTTVLTRSGLKRRATAYARASIVCWSTPKCAPDDSALPWPVSKYMTFRPTVPRFKLRAASWASASIDRLIPKPSLAFCEPAMD
jgi:hypothetical protein